MKEDGRFFVRFLLSNNLPGSVTRIVADTASILTHLGVPAMILYPTVDWWDFKRFLLPQTPFRRWKQRFKMAGEVLWNLSFRREWCGVKFHGIPPQVATERFLFAPSARNWGTGGITVVHPPYLVPPLLRTIPHPQMKLVSAIHVNLEKAMHSASAVTAAWYTHWVAMERYLSIPRYATSEEARGAAERLGIPIRTVIPGGVDLRLFHPRLRSLPEEALSILMYCDPNPQKGRDLGVEALRRVRAEAPRLRLYSVGKVSQDQARLFDRNYGYLHGESYAQALRECDVFVYPSRYDGFPAPPLQAMASGSALVTAAVEGVQGYARDEEDALLCPPGDVGGLTRQVLRLIADPALRARLQSNGPQRAKGWSMEASVQRLLQFLQEVAQESHVGERVPVS